jgi:hypothetical protein
MELLVRKVSASRKGMFRIDSLINIYVLIYIYNKSKTEKNPFHLATYILLRSFQTIY